MISSSRKVWVGSMTLSSVLLFSSLMGAHYPAQAAEPTTSLKTIVLSSNSVSGYSASATRNKIIASAGKTQTKQAEPTPKVQVAVAEDRKAEVAKTETKKETASKPKQVASATKQQTQVSRSSSTDSSKLVSNAMSLIGTSYVFGGTSRSGFDCSGYTQYVFKGSGISLPRTSYAQFGVGSAVSRNQLQPGDLVFFSTYDQGASHVGIYVGGGSFVHASNSGVRTTSLSESYYASRYMGARRVTN
ncbi:C40 family peptidase [Desulfitobacterium metallireducens]|uniref:Hydrolase n=1 Tax=Desulfitobacterium metallireducens DSM 15288 TaxID=871968 RepID=W0EB24_9FIRM|nr:C40 family peptidase [Desulfitobacterium metallireducens]AHF06708.1 hydrolase [Desulfitobacterium metallireducens DSM 15288]